MRIGFDAKRAFHTARGLGSYARTTITYLSQISPDDQFILFTPSLKKDKLSKWHLGLPNVQVVTPSQWWAKLFPSLWRSFYLSHEIEKHKIDLYHGLSHELPWRIEKTGIKTIVTIHDLIYVKFPRFFNFVDRWIFEVKFSSSIKRADKVITICHQTKDDVIDHFRCPKEKIEVVYQSCNPRFFEPTAEEVLKKVRNDLSLPARYLLFLGALVPNKNIELIMNSLTRFAVGQRPNFVIAGAPSSHLEQLKKLQSKLQLEDCVHWVLSPHDEQLPALYKMASVFCFPSFYEGFGIPVIESLCSGTPVITSNQGALKEAAGPGAQFIDPTSVDECYEAIKLLWSDDEARNNLSVHGREYVNRFSSLAVTHDLLSVYRATIAR